MPTASKGPQAAFRQASRFHEGLPVRQGMEMACPHPLATLIVKLMRASRYIGMSLCRRCYGSGVDIVFAALRPSADMGGWIAYWPNGPDGGLAYRRKCPACGGVGVETWLNPKSGPSKVRKRLSFPD